VNNISNISLLRIFLKWKFHLLIVTGLAVALGTVFSGETFIKPKYKSTAIVYPSNIIPYGNETPTDQMLQLFHASDIRSSVCNEFKLDKRYNVDMTRPGARSVLFEMYNENVDIRRTEFESVKIDVYDQDPLVASDMVDSILNLMNLKARALQRSKTAEVVKLLKDQMDFKQAQIDSLEKALRELRERFGVLDYYIQSKEALRAFYKLIGDGGSKDKLKELDTVIRNLEEKGGQSVSLKEIHAKLIDAYTDIKIQYDKALNDSKKELTYTNVITKPYPADRKSTPIRWLIVCVAGFSTFLFTLLIVLIIENREFFSKIEKN
jgi:hypothetical protein